MTSEEGVVSKCPICGNSTNLSFMKDSYEIYKCSSCDFLFVDPYPPNNDLIFYYNNNYRGIDINFYPKARSRQRRAFFKSFRFWRYLFNKRALDIGCGGGFMANAFRRLGAEAHGMDISENSIAYAKNSFPDCTFHCESFTSMAKSDLIFDFIFTTELLEHIRGPREIMELIVSISRPGTIVYLATPDTGHESVPVDISSWGDICPPIHIQWFNQSNMALLFDNYGFKLVRTFTKKTPALSMLFQRMDE